MLFELSRPMQEKGGKYNKNNDKIKLMMAYIHEHYSEKISISELAAAAYLSERECFRVFHDCLHTTPVEYINTYRLLGKVFREYAHCTSLEYRRKWQDSDI